jgi:hypothetical protein
MGSACLHSNEHDISANLLDMAASAATTSVAAAFATMLLCHYWAGGGRYRGQAVQGRRQADAYTK